MSDRYLEFTQSSFGKTLSGLMGLPQPPRLKRAKAAWAEQPLEGRQALIGAAPDGELVKPALKALAAMGAGLRIQPDHAGLTAIKPAAQALKLNLSGEPAKGSGEAASSVIVFDATGIDSVAGLRTLYDFFNPLVPAIPAGAHVLILGRAVDTAETVNAKTCSAALRGFLRSLAKEVGRKGITVNLLDVGAGAETQLEGPLRFLLTEHAAFITGQVLPLTAGRGKPAALVGSLQGKVALVTGAARGIGASIAETLAREGAQVIGLDHPSQEGALGETMGRIGGRGLALDVTAPDAASRIAAEVSRHFKGLDVVVHNAGVTRDKMIRNMPPHFWDMVLNINLGAILAINEGLLESRVLSDKARVVCISSIGGIAGNAGQTNYGATKAGVIGYVAAMAEALAEKGGAINAVAPGFIETQMTAEMPVGPREVGRRLASLGQGGQPQDIAEAVTFLASAAAGGVNGATLRVCGQNFVGA